MPNGTLRKFPPIPQAKIFVRHALLHVALEQVDMPSDGRVASLINLR
jgi:hypothetical protein